MVPKNFAVLDVETRRSADEVGGWEKCEDMGISVAVAWFSKDDAYCAFAEDEEVELYKRLTEVDLVVGFNLLRFDYRVLHGVKPPPRPVPHDPILANPYYSLPTLDLMDDLKRTLGKRVGLDRCAEATLGAGKSADGIQALRWWKEGKIDNITRYCECDVQATRDLYFYGLRHNHIRYIDKETGESRMAGVNWHPPLKCTVCGLQTADKQDMTFVGDPCNGPYGICRQCYKPNF